MPRPAAERRITPRFVGLLTRSSTTTRRAASSTSAAGRGGRRSKQASRPRWTPSPVMRCSTAGVGGVDGHAGIHAGRQRIGAGGVDQHRQRLVAGADGALRHDVALGDEHPDARPAQPGGPARDRAGPRRARSGGHGGRRSAPRARAHGFAGGCRPQGLLAVAPAGQDDSSMTFEPADTPDTQPPDPVLGQPMTSSVAGP